MAHAFLSPSGAPAWSRCLIKPWREKDLPNTSSDAADEGTAAHFLMEKCLIQKAEAKTFQALRIKVGEEGCEFHTGGQYPVGLDMAREVQKALDYINAVAEGATIYSEQVLSIEHITGEEGATGTTDALVIRGKVAHVFDLKYGRGVQVFAEGNEQELIYADSALKEFDLLDEVEEVHLHIVQPRLNHFDEWVITRAELTAEIEKLKAVSVRILAPLNRDDAEDDKLEATPGDKQCKFCLAKGTCPEYRDFVLGEVTEGFVDLDKGFIEVSLDQAEKLLAQSFGVKPAAVDFDWTPNDEHTPFFTVKKPSILPDLHAAEAKLATAEDARLATLMDAADMIEGFAKAVRAEVERRLLLGTFTDARYKLVQGKKGNRNWSNEEEAEAALKAMRLKVDQMYDFKLISPTTAEKVLAESNPRKWAKLQQLIGQSEGKPSVAPASDKRPALSIAVADQFEVLEPETVAEDCFNDLV